MTIAQSITSTNHKKDTALVTDTAKKILSYSIQHFFSDTVNKDNFSITLYGKSIVNGEVVFEISDHLHKRLFKETYPASDMLGDMEDVLNIKQQADTIKARMADFLEEDSFFSPAIGKKDAIEDDFENVDKADIINWNDIKSDATAVRFTYSHGYEGTYGIAYSKKRKKVVLIFASD